MDRTVGGVRFLKEWGGRTHQERTRPKDATGGAEMKDKETDRACHVLPEPGSRARGV